MVRTNRQPTLAELRERREQILRIATTHGAANVRIFGSVARGEADSASDVDVLIDVVSDAWKHWPTPRAISPLRSGHAILTLIGVRSVTFATSWLTGTRPFASI